MPELSEIARIKAEKILEEKKEKQTAQMRAYAQSLRAIIDMQMGVTGILPYRIVLDNVKRFMSGECSEHEIPNSVYPHNGEEIGQRFITIDTPQDERKAFYDKYGIKEGDTEYYYTHFLQGYDIDSFRPFDFTGGRIEGVHIEEWRELLKRLQEDFTRNPQNYYIPGENSGGKGG